MGEQFWKLFEEPGSIDAYMGFKDFRDHLVEEDEVSEGDELGL